MNKKLISLILAVSMGVSFVVTGCNKDNAKESEVSGTSDTSMSESESESVTETEAEAVEEVGLSLLIMPEESVGKIRFRTAQLADKTPDVISYVDKLEDIPDLCSDSIINDLIDKYRKNKEMAEANYPADGFADASEYSKYIKNYFKQEDLKNCFPESFTANLGDGIRTYDITSAKFRGCTFIISTAKTTPPDGYVFIQKDNNHGNGEAYYAIYGFEITFRCIPTSDPLPSEATTDDTTASASEAVLTKVDISKVPESKQLKTLLGKWTFPNLKNSIHQDYFTSGTAGEILSGGQSGTPLDYSIYPNKIKLEGSGYSKYYSMSMDELNWIEENILNLTEEERDLFNESLKGYYAADSNFENGIVHVAYLSSALKIKVKNTLQTDGIYYYAVTTVTGYEADEKFTYNLYFTMELKQIDGKKYWSIVNCSMDPFEFDK